MNILKYCNTLVIVSLMCFLYSSCTDKKQYYFSKGNIFKTSYHIKYEHTIQLDKEIKDELNRFDLSLNPFNKESVIYKINNNQNFIPDDLFLTVIQKANDVSERTNGAFDITCAPLINLWGFGFNKIDSISPQIIDSLKNYVGYKKIHYRNNRIEKDDPGIQINASAIAKGYACDVIGNLLESYGINNYMVEIGGEIKMKGKNPKQTCWKIELTKPIDDNTGIQSERQEVIQICNGALATSGNYRNYYIKNGKKYAHTIDPITGYPAEQNILSATVIAPECIIADAYATAFMVLGLEKASQLGDSLPELAYYFVYCDDQGNYQVKYSDNMKQFIVP